MYTLFILKNDFRWGKTKIFQKWGVADPPPPPPPYGHIPAFQKLTVLIRHIYVYGKNFNYTRQKSFKKIINNLGYYTIHFMSSN